MKTNDRLCQTTRESPIGPLTLFATGKALVGLYMGERRPAWPEAAERSTALLERAGAQLDEYFARTRRRFDLPLAPAGTEFQREVWAVLRTIPFGATWSYAEVARRIGRPGAVRAVGAANGQNPIGIVIPCHRVVGSDGSLTGYGGGLPRKRWLLTHEGVELPLGGEGMDLLASSRI